MKNNLFLLIALAFSLILISCKTIKVKAPPRLPPNPPSSEIKNSTIRINVSVSESDIIKAVKESVSNPVIQDNPFPVNARLLTKQSITEKELVKKVITPYVPGHWIEIYTKTYRTVRKSFSCALKPWKWGTCWKDVLEEIWVTTRVWVEPQLEVAIWITKEVIKYIDKIYKVEARVHYPTYLEDLEVGFNENNFIVKSKFKTKLKFDYDHALIPLGPTLSLNSILEFPLYTNVTVKGKITIVSPGKVVVTIDKGSTNFEFDPLSPNLPVIDGSTLETLLFPKIKLIIQPLIEKLIEKKLNDVIIKEIDQNSEKLNFRDQINNVVMYIGEPKLLSENLWLNVQPIKILSGQINGMGTRLFYSAGLEFRPEIEYTPNPPRISPNAIPFEAANEISSQSNINLKASVKLIFIEEALKNLLNEYIKSVNTIRKLVIVDDVDIYNTSDNKVAIKVRILRKRILKNYSFFANAYVTTEIAYDNLRGIFSFEDISFTLETKNALISSIINPLVNTKAEELLKQNSSFSVSDEIRIANSVIRDTSLMLPYGTLNIKFDPIAVSTPFLTSTDLQTNINFCGLINFAVSDGSLPTFSNSFPNNQLVINNIYDVNCKNKLKKNKFNIGRERNVISSNLISDRYNFTPDSIYSDFDRVNFAETSSSEFPIAAKFSEYISRLKIGDTIFVESEGVIRKQIIGFQDLPNPNEEALVSITPGRVNRVRVNSQKDGSLGSESTHTENIDVISIRQAAEYIDKCVIIKGKMKCFKEYTDFSGETICSIMLEACNNEMIDIKIYKGSVSDYPPSASQIDKVFYITGCLDFENGKPVMKVTQNGKIRWE